MLSVTPADRKFSLIWFGVAAVFILMSCVGLAMLSGWWLVLPFGFAVCGAFSLATSASLNRPRRQGRFFMGLGTTIILSALAGYPLANYIVPILHLSVEAARGAGIEFISADFMINLENALRIETIKSTYIDRFLSIAVGFGLVGIGVLQSREPLKKEKITNATEITNRLRIGDGKKPMKGEANENIRTGNINKKVKKKKRRKPKDQA